MSAASDEGSTKDPAAGSGRPVGHAAPRAPHATRDRAERVAPRAPGAPDWSTAVDHRQDDAVAFLRARWERTAGTVLLVAGAGFDPRASRIPMQLLEMLGERLRVLLVKEERPAPSAEQVARAATNLMAVTSALSTAQLQIETVSVFGTGGAVVGGRAAAALAARVSLEGVSDVVIDFSALSIGISFPMTAALLERARRSRLNVHAVVLADSSVDAAIRPAPAEAAIPIHGFQHGWQTDALDGTSLLWLPQLAPGQRELLDRIFREVRPHDICPILPFPAADPRRADALVTDYLQEFESGWEVDQRSIIFAAENSPLDVYRTVLALDDERRPVFDGHGSSLCVLSPVGSKVVALGSMMAALQRNFPVLYVEAVGYEVDLARLDELARHPGELVHVWLDGDPYSPEPPAHP